MGLGANGNNGAGGLSAARIQVVPATPVSAGVAAAGQSGLNVGELFSNSIILIQCIPRYGRSNAAYGFRRAGVPRLLPLFRQTSFSQFRRPLSSVLRLILCATRGPIRRHPLPSRVVRQSDLRCASAVRGVDVATVGIDAV